MFSMLGADIPSFAAPVPPPLVHSVKPSPLHTATTTADGILFSVA